jgi:hypothetical protein
MSKVTEEDIINYYMPLVLQECKNSYKGLEWEDRLAEGGVSLIYAIRTYKTKYGEFEDYFVVQLRRIMTEKNKEAWAMKKMESHYSLDASFIKGKENYSLSNLIGGTSHDETLLDVKNFRDGLSSIEKSVIDLLTNNYTTGIDLSIESLHQVQTIIDCLKDKVSAYFIRDI